MLVPVAVRGITFLGTGRMDGCKPPCASWVLNPGPRLEEQVLLTAAIPSISKLCFCLVDLI